MITRSVDVAVLVTPDGTTPLMEHVVPSNFSKLFGPKAWKALGFTALEAEVSNACCALHVVWCMAMHLLVICILAASAAFRPLHTPSCMLP